MKNILYILTNFIKDSWLTIGASLLFLILIEYSLNLGMKYGLLESDLSILKGTILDEKSAIPENYADASWFREYTKEASHVFFQTEWSPYLYWKTRPFSGKYININADSSRKTWSPPMDSTKPIYHIFMFGGSTLWGWGARDDYTIPSLVAKILHNKYNVQAHITNFGELGYVSTQELIRYMKELQHKNIPHLVVFYDGLNDIFSALQSNEAGIPHNEFKRKSEFEDGIITKVFASFTEHSKLYKLIFSIFGKNNHDIKINIESQRLNQLSDNIVNTYAGNMNIIKSISSLYKIKTLFYWQPTIFTKNDLSSSEKIFAKIHAYSEPLYKSTYKKISTLEENNFSNISNILSGYNRSFYIDPWHIDEYGNEIIAQKIADDISKTLVAY